MACMPCKELVDSLDHLPEFHISDALVRLVEPLFTWFPHNTHAIRAHRLPGPGCIAKTPADEAAFRPSWSGHRHRRPKWFALQDRYSCWPSTEEARGVVSQLSVPGRQLPKDSLLPAPIQVRLSGSAGFLARAHCFPRIIVRVSPKGGLAGGVDRGCSQSLVSPPPPRLTVRPKTMWDRLPACHLTGKMPVPQGVLGRTPSGEVPCACVALGIATNAYLSYA